MENGSDEEYSFFSSLALRMLHESVFKYGYQIKLSAAYDDSLETMKLWISSKEFLEKKVIDSPTVRTNFLTPQTIRGTKENWLNRFMQLSKGRASISFDDFSSNVFTPDIDSKDREVLFLLISGTWPTRRLALVREYGADRVIYRYENEEAEEKSFNRRRILGSVCSPPVASSVFEDRKAACKTFWRVYVLQLKNGQNKDVAIVFEDYRDIILCGMEWIKIHGNDVLVKGAKAAATRDKLKELI